MQVPEVKGSGRRPRRIGGQPRPFQSIGGIFAPSPLAVAPAEVDS